MWCDRLLADGMVLFILIIVDGIGVMWVCIVNFWIIVEDLVEVFVMLEFGV